MRTFGLIGYPLSHSFSQKYFTEKFKRENLTDCEFKNFPLEDINEFPILLKNTLGLCGLSITIPHKQTIIEYLNKIEESAKEIGAVNCIKKWQMADGKWQMMGFNTDVVGFEQSIKPLIKDHHLKALILGTGGASKAVAFVLKKMGIEFLFVYRNKHPEKRAQYQVAGSRPALPAGRYQAPSVKYRDLSKEIISKHLIIINTTPLGTFPNIHDYPDIPYEHLSSKHLLYDLTYNPEESAFLKKGKAHGAQIKNGLEMLHLQAEKAWEIWNT